MSSKSPDVYIQILKYASENEGFSFQQIFDKFPGHRRLLQYCVGGERIFIRIKSDQYMLSYEGRFHLLEYEELQDARKSSKNAMKVATISICLTLVSLFLAIIGLSYSIFSTPEVIVKNPVTIIEKSTK